MGQAKARGTYEQRRTEGEAKLLALTLARKEELAEKKRKDAQAFAALPIAEQKKLLDRQALLQFIVAVAEANRKGLGIFSNSIW